MPDIRNVYGLWCDDITFCQEECEHLDCPRNQQNIRDRSVPHSFSVEIPKDCPKKQEGRKSKTPDREKVAKDLADIGAWIAGRVGFEMARNFMRTIDDAVALLKEKEKEAKIPSLMQDVEGIWLTCPTCGNKLRAILAMKMDTYLPKYCQECGQAVKWE